MGPTEFESYTPLSSQRAILARNIAVGFVVAGFFTIAVKAVFDYQNNQSNSEPMLGNAGNDIDLYPDLQDFLNDGFNGRDVDEDGRNIRPLLEESKFSHQINLNSSTPAGVVISEEGSKLRWFPAIDKLYPDGWEGDLTTAPRSEWRQYCEGVKQSRVVVTTYQIRSDGTYVVTDWIEERTALGRRFIAVKNEVNRRGEQLVAFEPNIPDVCKDSPTQDFLPSK